MKAKSVLDQAVLKYSIDNGENPSCGYLKTEGSPVVDFSECAQLYNSFKNSLNTLKICESNAYENGCIPEYEGNDTIYAKNNPNTSEEDAIQATQPCAGWNKSDILSGKAMVLTDGMIIFPYRSFNTPIIGVDLNGQAGPNKWGIDIHSFILNSQPYFDAYYSGCEPIEAGGIHTKTLLYNKNYI